MQMGIGLSDVRHLGAAEISESFIELLPNDHDPHPECNRPDEACERRRKYSSFVKCTACPIVYHIAAVGCV